MTILLTGATGFIGQHVLNLLLALGDTVVTYGRSAPSTVPIPIAARHRHVTGDLATGENLDHLPWAEIGQVIHLAAAGVKASKRAWPQTIAVNITGTQHLLHAIATACHHHKNLPTIFLARTFYEAFAATNPALLENPYIATKAAASEHARLFAQRYQGRVIFGTFFQVYGPGDDPGNLLSYAAREFTAARQATFGSGLGQRDWIHITDAAHAVLACLAGDATQYDIGSGQLLTIREMVEELHHLTPAAPKPLFDPSRDRPDVALTAFARDIPLTSHTPLSTHAGLATLLNS